MLIIIFLFVIQTGGDSSTSVGKIGKFGGVGSFSRNRYSAIARLLDPPPVLCTSRRNGTWLSYTPKDPPGIVRFAPAAGHACSYARTLSRRRVVRLVARGWGVPDESSMFESARARGAHPENWGRPFGDCVCCRVTERVAVPIIVPGKSCS